VKLHNHHGQRRIVLLIKSLNDLAKGCEGHSDPVIRKLGPQARAQADGLQALVSQKVRLLVDLKSTTLILDEALTEALGEHARLRSYVRAHLGLYTEELAHFDIRPRGKPKKRPYKPRSPRTP
jgi:hypothetical protein